MNSSMLERMVNRKNVWSGFRPAAMRFGLSVIRYPPISRMRGPGSGISITSKTLKM